MNQKDFENKAKEIMDDVKDSSSEFSSEDIDEGKVIAIISYIGVLSVVGYAMAGTKKYAAFHAKQGLNLFIIEIILGIALSLLSVFLPNILEGLVKIIGSLVNLGFLALSILGIINAVNGKAKELPVVNKIKLIK